MDAINHVESSNKESIQQVSSEIQRENAANFVGLERFVRLKLEALELRLTSSIEGLRQEVTAQISTLINTRSNGKLYLFVLYIVRIDSTSGVHIKPCVLSTVQGGESNSKMNSMRTDHASSSHPAADCGKLFFFALLAG